MDSSMILPNLLPKLANEDYDFRFMGLTDIQTHLNQPDSTIPQHNQSDVYNAIVKLTRDSRLEIVNLALKTLALVLTKLPFQYSETTIKHLFDLLNENEDRSVESATTGFSQILPILSNSPVEVRHKIVKQLTVDLLNRISSESTPQDHIHYYLEVLIEVFNLWGSLVFSDSIDDTSKSDSQLQNDTLSAVIPLLQSNKSILRRKSVNVLNCLIPLLDDTHYARIVDHLKERLGHFANMIVPSPPGEGVHSEHTRTILQALTTLVKLSGDKLSPHVSEIVPHLFALIEIGVDEVKEAALQCVEYVVLKCGDALQPYMQEILVITVKNLRYDPNYADDDDDEDAMETDEDQDDEFLDDEDEDGLYSDDEDLSWKVRRTSAKIFVSLFATQSQLLAKFHEELAPVLIKRFSEREENVRIEVIQAYITLLHHTREIVRNVNIEYNQLTPIESDTIISSYINKRRKVTTPPMVESFENQDSIGYSCQQSLIEGLPRLIASIVKQLNSKSLATHQSIFQLLDELTLVIPGQLSPHLDSLAPYIQRALGTQGTKLIGLNFAANQTGTTLQSTTLLFVKDLLKTHDITVFGTHLSWLTDVVIAGLEDAHRAKSNEQGYRTYEQYLKVLRADEMPPVSGVDAQFVRIYKKLVNIIQETTSASDTVGRNRAFACLGVQLTNGADLLGSEISDLGPLLEKHISEVPAPLSPLKTLFLLFQCPFVEWSSISQDHPLSQISARTIAILPPFLQKSSAQLKLAGLMALFSMVSKIDRFFNSQMFKSILLNLQGLISDSDLQTLPIAVDLLSECIKDDLDSNLRNSNLSVITSSSYLTTFSELLKSPVLQGATLDKVVAFFRQLVTAADSCGQPKVGEQLLEVVQQPIRQSGPDNAWELSKSAYTTLAKVTAGLTLTSESRVQALIPNLAQIIQNEGYHGQHLHLSLLVIGELGRSYDLSGYEPVFTACLQHLGNAEAPEDIKLASAFALGGITVSKLEFFLPKLLNQLRTDHQNRYLLLHALKEVTAQFANTYSTIDAQVRAEYGREFWSLLTGDQDSNLIEQEEGTRNLVSEALSHVLSTDPTTFLPELQQRIAGSAPAGVQSTLIAALRYTLTHLAALEQLSANALEPLLVATLQTLLPHLTSSNLDISKISIVTFNASIHHQPKLVRTLLPELIPKLLDLSQPRPELMRVVDMGPFKVNVDDGLEVRKSTYECWYTLLNVIPDRFDLKPVVLQAIRGLSDLNEIKQLAHTLLLKLSQVAPTTVAAQLDHCVEALDQTLSVKLKDNAIKQDREKQQDMVVSVLRLLKGLEPLLALNLSPKFQAFFLQTTQASQFRDIYVGLSH